MKRKIISFIITLLIGVLSFYVFLPALNIHSFGFWVFICYLIIIYSCIAFTSKVREIFNTNHIAIKRNKKDIFKFNIIFLVPIIFIGIIVLDIIGGPIFNAKKYANRITIDEAKTFTDDVKPVDFTKLPLLDKDSSEKLGDRVMGQMSELVSQFNVSDIYTQINYNDKIVRVTPLEYASFIKWITNRKDGVRGYITVDSVSGEANLTKLNKGMKYVPSAHFNELLTRKLRFSYPTDIFGRISFEIDNEGNPYWIVPVITYKWIGLRAEVTDLIIFNPFDGSSQKLKISEVPTWVDMAYSADLIIEQVNDWGTYKNGFFNSVIGQKSVVNTTEGYNYLAMNDDIYLYTGITSIVADESNLGFILTNMRTKETSFYSAPGAEEYSAMASAEGAVQQMKYTSTFPLLINLNNKPTYLVSLKDDAGLVKMYGFVDVADYQKVVVTDSSKGILVAAQNYLGDEKEVTDESNIIIKTITIKSIKDAVINSNTYYYIIDEDDNKYKVSINVSDNLPFLKNGSTIKIGYSIESEITNIIKIY